MSNYGMWGAEMICFIFRVVLLLLYAMQIKKRKFLTAGEEVVVALGSEVDRLENEIQQLVPGIQHVDIEAHNPIEPPQ